MKTMLALAFVAGLVAPSPTVAQGEPSGRQAFFAAAAGAADRYSDRREAIADGFRRIGPDFPGMGVHWVHTSRIVAGELRGDRPSVLCYVDIAGTPTLVGLAYTLPLSGDESPPSEPFDPEVWHDHSGQVTEESLLLNHPSSAHAADPTFRLSMVHVWLPASNPAGLLAQNNWTIPFMRAGLKPPSAPTSGPARGLSLGSWGIDFYRELLSWAAPLSGAEQEVVERLLRQRADEVDGLVVRHDGEWSAEDLQELERAWIELWDDLERSLDPRTYESMRPLKAGT
jgi:hypothetical protein